MNVKEKALETIGDYMDDASKKERKELLLFLEGFAYHSKIANKPEQPLDEENIRDSA